MTPEQRSPAFYVKISHIFADKRAVESRDRQAKGNILYAASDVV